jgi:protein-tyrosine-phosphatase
MVILREKLARRNLPGVVESRGVIARTGAGMERTTVRILTQLGYPLPSHHATPLLYEDRDRFDLFLAMDAWVKEETERILYAPPPPVYRLLDFIGKPGDIPDPYQADERIIGDTIRRIESAIDSLVQKLYP